MKKGIKIVICVLALAASFLFGWRLMPKVWPAIKENVVYPLFPQMKPEPAPTQQPYHPQSDSAFGDTVYETDSVIYYFYKDYCPYCRALSNLTDALPKQITLPGGTSSDVRLICINKVEDKYLQVITDYYKKNNIPEDRRYVPAMVIGDRYLFLENEIVDQLMDALVAGEGLQTPLLDGNQRVPKNE